MAKSYDMLIVVVCLIIPHCHSYSLISRLKHPNQVPILNGEKCQLSTSRSHKIPNTSVFFSTPLISSRQKLKILSRRSLGNGLLEAPLFQSLFKYTGHVPFEQAFAMNVVLFTIFRNKLLSALTPSGFFHAMALGTTLWMTLGWRGWSLCVLYLILGQAVTKVRFAQKTKLGIAESRGGRRGPENVWGSAATGLLCAICAAQGISFLGISSDLYILAYVASLSTKLADTFASEIGKAYGKTTFLITTFELVEPGTEGAVSMEGTAAAVLGGLLLSLFGFGIGLLDNISAVLVSVFAAFTATNVESLIGAALQGKDGLRWLTNELVNFVNTFIGASIALIFGKLLLRM